MSIFIVVFYFTQICLDNIDPDGAVRPGRQYPEGGKKIGKGRQIIM